MRPLIPDPKVAAEGMVSARRRGANFNHMFAIHRDIARKHVRMW